MNAVLNYTNASGVNALTLLRKVLENILKFAFEKAKTEKLKTATKSTISQFRNVESSAPHCTVAPFFLFLLFPSSRKYKNTKYKYSHKLNFYTSMHSVWLHQN